MLDLAQVLQLVGALAILFPFAGLQLGKLVPTSLTYLTLNLFGAALLAVLAFEERQWGFLLLETCWAAVAGWGLLGRLRGPSPGATG